jgi:hypothetical protein
MNATKLCRVTALSMMLALGACSGNEPKVPVSAPAGGSEEFLRISQVLKSPRCLNCHPKGDAPRQGDERRLHDEGVKRGDDDHGVPGLTCNTCHQDANQEESGVPGALRWHVAPLSMGWEGLSDAELCRDLLDPFKNGGRTPDDLVHHLTDDPFIKWAWEPGGERTPPPIPRNEFLELARTWAAKGAACP